MIPAHLQATLREHESGDLDERDSLQFYADLLVASAQDSPDVPQEIRTAIDGLILDGSLSAAGDVLRWPGEGEPPMVYKPLDQGD